EAQAASASPIPAAAGKGKSGGFPLARTGASLTLGVLGVLATATGVYVLRLRRRKA
ncbi:LPXTG-motif protein cell wall anchor domain protein, partial [Actinomyces johnsonii F0510]